MRNGLMRRLAHVADKGVVLDANGGKPKLFHGTAVRTTCVGW